MSTVAEYKALKERGEQLFDGLRDLPQFGKRLWEPYFRRTFDVYNQLWKFQQEHRGTLEAEYGLQRHEIGEIASRIGQLYYQFYLRKGDTCYLDEAYVFYEAIRARQYLGDTTSPGTHADLAVLLRRLRYYTRFCVVCLLTGRRGRLLELLRELDQLVSQSKPMLSPAERGEWALVLSEFRSFVQVERPLSVRPAPAADDGAQEGSAGPRPPVALETPRRLRAEQVEPQVALLRGAAAMARVQPRTPLTLHEVVLVGTQASQPKFHDLHLDAFRMLQALEWQPSALHKDAPKPPPTSRQASDGAEAGAGAAGASAAAAGSVGAGAAERANPHKYVLQRATAAQLTLVLATAMVELPPRGALLLYLSCDGLHTAATARGLTAKEAPMGGGGDRDGGGISSGGGGGGGGGGGEEEEEEAKRDEARSDAALWQQGGVALALESDAESGAPREACCWRPADLWPFCRMPLLLVVESDNARAFRALPAAAAAASSAPLLCLLAPRCALAGRCARLAGGGLLTLFLHEPVAAFCVLGGVTEVPEATHSQLEALLLHSFAQTTRALLACPETPAACLAFLSEPFCRTLILRFVFCHATLCLHKTPRPGAPPELPESAPPLPSAVLLDDAILGVVRQLAAILGIVSQFHATVPLEVVGSREA